MLKVLGAAAVVGAVVTASATGAIPSGDELRREVRDFGPLAPVAYVAAYAVLACLPTPASLLTITGGALFGLGWGTAYAWLGAMAAAVLAFELGRLLGHDAVQKITRGRLDAAQRVLDEHGFAAMLAIRLTPVFPYLAVNYGAGLSSLARRDYLLATALGILPGAVAYVAVGAYGTDPLGIFAALAGLVVLTAVGGYVGRRMLRRQGVDPEEPGESPEGGDSAVQAP